MKIGPVTHLTRLSYTVAAAPAHARFEAAAEAALEADRPRTGAPGDLPLRHRGAVASEAGGAGVSERAAIAALALDCTVG